MKYVILFSTLILSLILVTNYDLIFAEHMDLHHDDIEQHETMNENVQWNHHIPYKGMCGPGFTSLKEMCVLDDRCGPGIYAGKVCTMDGIAKQYLRPLHQKHAGISIDNIICAEGKHLIFKHHDATPACVNSSSVEKLEHRGWQTEKPAIACTMEYSPICGVDGITYGNMCSLSAQHMTIKYHGKCFTSKDADDETKYSTQELKSRKHKIDEKFLIFKQDYEDETINKEKHYQELLTLKEAQRQLYEDVSNHDFGDDELKEYNYWVRGVKKFPSQLDQEFNHIKEELELK